MLLSRTPDGDCSFIHERSITVKDGSRLPPATACSVADVSRDPSGRWTEGLSLPAMVRRFTGYVRDPFARLASGSTFEPLGSRTGLARQRHLEENILMVLTYKGLAKPGPEQINEIRRLHLAGKWPRRGIARDLHIGRHTPAKRVSLAKTASWAASAGSMARPGRARCSKACRWVIPPGLFRWSRRRVLWSQLEKAR